MLCSGSLQNTALRSKFDRKTGTTYCRNMISLKNISLSNPSPVIVSLLSSWATKGTVALPNQMTFRKVQIKKFILQILGTWNRHFLAWDWFKRVISGFRVCFFNNCIEKNQNKTHFEEGSSSHTSLRDGSGYQNGWIFGKVPNGHWPPAPQNGPYLWKSCAYISYYRALIHPCMYSTISIIKKIAT